MSLSVDRLDRSHLEPVSHLCQRAIVDPPSLDELDGALFATDQSVALLGDPAAGVVAIAECADGAHIRLLAVDPSARGQGNGGALLRAAEEWAAGAGHRSLVTGADPPYHLWPGVPITETALLCLLESRHYVRSDTNFDMRVDLGPVPPDPGGHALARSTERAEIEEWAATHWPGWLQEVSRAADKGNLVLAREAGDHGDVIAFCAFEVNRRGVLGPVAVRPDLIGRGAGRAVLLGALHELRRRGRSEVSVAWVGPIVPYASVGGVVAEVYFVYRKELG